MSEELESYSLGVPRSRDQQIWCRSDLGLQRDKFYAAFYAIEALQRQQQAETKIDVEKSVENLFLDRLSLLFARIKNDKRKTPLHVTATCLVPCDSRWNVYIAKNDGLQESEKSFAKKLQDWIREEANSETLFNDDYASDELSIDEEDESIEAFDSEAKPMTIRMADFWKDRVDYYARESQDAWDRINRSHDAKIGIENYFKERDQKFTKQRFDRDWDKAAKLAQYLRDRPANTAITKNFLVKFYRFWNRKEREDWYKPLESELTKARDFRKCIRYMEMLGMPISTWNAFVRFRKLPNYKTIHLIAIDKPIFDESRLDKSGIIKVFNWWKTKNSIIKSSLPLESLERMDIEPELFFHCELQILNLLTLVHSEHGHYFIGCSKLSCESCWQILRHDGQFTTRGSHHKISANCAFPFPSHLESIGRRIKYMQSTWKKTIFTDSIYRKHLSIDDTDQAPTRWNVVAEESTMDIPSRPSGVYPYIIDQHIKPGEGSFASVFSATKSNQAPDNSLYRPHAPYALKAMTITSPRKIEMVRNEIKILRRLQNHSHRNILRLENEFFVEDSRTVFLATQPYAPLSLEKFFTKTLLYDREEWHEPYHLLQWPRIIRQCLEGLEFLHTQEPQILHGDLKPQNILLWRVQDPDGSVEIRPIIADFGISTDRTVKHSDQQGTIEYMSPEVLDGASKSIHSDVWALGCCFAQIFVLLYFGEKSLAELRDAVHNPDQRGFSKNLNKVEAMLTKSDGKNHPDPTLELFRDFRETVWGMLRPDPSARLRTHIAIADLQELKARLDITKLNISGLTICFTFGPVKVSRGVDGPNLLSITDLIIFCKDTAESQRSAVSFGVWWLLKFYIKPSIPRLVYLTMPKDEKTHVTHIEEDLASTLSSKKESTRKKTDSTKLPPQSPYISQILNNQQSVNGTIEEFWKVEKFFLVHSSRSWTTSLHVLRAISNLSQAWKSTASSGERKTKDRECGLEIKYYLEKSRIISGIAFLACIVYGVYMVGAAEVTLSSVAVMLLIMLITLGGDFRGMLEVSAFLLLFIGLPFGYIWFDLEQYVGLLGDSEYWRFFIAQP